MYFRGDFLFVSQLEKLNIEFLVNTKMAEGKGCKECDAVHDGDFYNVCRCTCHDKIAREIVGEFYKEYC